MGLSPGDRLGAYEIVGLIGAGGMGEVYRAVDPRVDRHVAIKVLPEALAADPERTGRFQREAKVLASLNHPQIAALFGLETDAARQFLVMELVNGETLADRLSHGPLSVGDALKFAIEIAEGLEAAHESGIVHRDLKPANVKITRDERVKILDFGLARVLETTPASANLTNSPTLSALGTQVGVILGTAAYMAPEQAKGLQADHRSDIFSFGVVLYEMLTGRNPFKGDTAPEVLASILVHEADLTALPQGLNPRLLELLRRCLAKNPKKRWQAIGDVRAELETIVADPQIGSVPKPTVSAARRIMQAAAIFVAGAVLAGGTVWMARSDDQSRQLARFQFSLGEGEDFSSAGRQVIAISPDGSKLVYVANRRIYLRALAELQARPIQGSEDPTGIMSPAFSPDGQSIAFFSVSSQAIKRIPLTGGTPVSICPVNAPTGLSWTDGKIVFGDSAGRILSTSDTPGAKAEQIVILRENEFAYRPQLLPGTRHILLSVTSAEPGPDQWDKGQIVVQSLETGERQVLVSAGSDARYLPSGHIVYAVEGVVFAIVFDIDRLRVVGSPVAVVEGVARSAGPATGVAQFATSDNGSLLFIPGPRQTSALRRLGLTIVDRRGRIEPLALASQVYRYPRVAPDGKRMAVQIDEKDQSDIWIHEFAAGASPRKLTFDGQNRYPVWLPDGERIAFQSNREGHSGIFWQRSNGDGTAERLTTAEAGDVHIPYAWSPDGNTLILTIQRDRKFSLWSFSVREKKLTPVGSIESDQPLTPALSHDGRWVAYGNDLQTGGAIIVEPFPPTGTRHQIAAGGSANNPFWSWNDGELYYGQGGEPVLAAFAIRRQPSFGFTQLPPIGRPGYIGAGANSFFRNIDAFPDGRFIMVTAADGGRGPASQPIGRNINVVLNWFEDLKRLAPTK